MTPPRAIVYDAVGTLIHVHPSVAAIYLNVGQRFGSRLDANEIRQRFPLAFAKQEQIDRDLGWRTDEERERQRWRDIVAQVLDDVADPLACFDALFDEFAQPAVWRYDPDFASVFAALKQRGVVQALASNFDARLHGLTREISAVAELTPIVISSEVGWRKPAPQFFAHLTQKLGLAAAEIRFVGDDRGNDFDGARQAGMQAILFDPHRKHLDVAERIERLDDLL